MNLRKILSFTIVMSTIITTLPGVFAQNGNYNNDGSYTPPVKIQRLLKLESKLTPYIEAQLNRRIQSIDDKQLKRFYLYEISLQKEKIKQYFEELKYTYSDDDYTSKLQELRGYIIGIRDLIVEAEKSSAENTNPYLVSDVDKSSVEANILSGQKDIVGYIKNILQMYDGKDIKQANPSIFHFEGEIGTVDVNLEKNSSIFSWVTGNQELDLSLNAAIDLKIPGNSVVDASGNYGPGKTKSIKGNAKIDGNMKTIGSDMYFTLRDYTIELSTDDKSMTTELKDIKATLDAFKGKTVHVKLPENASQLDGKKILATFKSVLDVLEKEPLLTPYKKIDNHFALEPKRSTLNIIGTTIDAPITDENYLSMRKDFHANPVWYGVLNNGYELWVNINEHGASGEMRLSAISNTYAFTSYLVGSNNEKMNMEIRKGYLNFSAQSTEGMANILWENNILAAEVSGMGQKVSITGPLSSTNADLKINYNDKEIGNIKVVGTETHSVYEVNFGLDIPSPWKFSWKGTVDIDHGVFAIEKPTDALEFDAVLPGKSGNFEQGAFNPLDF